MISGDNAGNPSERENDEDSARSTDTTFDKTIAAKHEYLGTDLEEVGGRTFHDEGSIIWIPILRELEVVLVPGQTLPLTAFYPPTVAMFRKIISEDKTFGVMCVSHVAQYGTTAEIFQYQEDNDQAGFKIKAKGRQRFKLLEARGQTGVLLGRVLILPEVSLANPLQAFRILSLDRHRKNCTLKNRIECSDAALTPWPSWIFRQYDTEFLVTFITNELRNIHTGICNSTLPTDPVDLSYWIAQCLPIDGENREKLLSFNTAVERLQYAQTLISKCHKLYCLNCGNSIADKRDIFSMSIDGPQGMYCNPGGYVHDIVTVYNGAGLNLAADNPSAEYSWFPGYGWTIAQCSNCDFHIGWLFTALKSHLKPEKFWGLSRRSITTHQKSLLAYAYKIESCESQGPSGSKNDSTKGTAARKRKAPDNKGKVRSSTEGGGGQSVGPAPFQTTRGGLRVYKVVVLGDGGVGKSALTLQFVSHSFSEYHDPTIEDAYQQQAVIDGEAALLDILDTAGQIEFNAMRDQYMRCGEGFMVCYSVTDRHSFEEAVEYKKLIYKVRASEDIPLVLVGNKCDLQHQRKVAVEEGRDLAQQFGCPFFETSAALRHFVDDAFHTLIREIRAKEKGRLSTDKLNSSKWKRLKSILSVIFKKKSHYSF